MRRSVRAVLVVAVVALAAPAAASAADTARYILPPGNYGGLADDHELARPAPALRRADAAARQRHRRRTSTSYFLPENFAPIGATHEEQTGRPGLRLIYDSYGIPHVYGRRAPTSPSAPAGRPRATAACCSSSAAARPAWPSPTCPASTPSAWSRAGSRSCPSAADRGPRRPQQKSLLVETYGDKGRQILADAQAYADGINAYWKANNINQPPATVNDVIAVTAFIGSIFGAGGGGEASNADLLAKLQDALGPVRGYKAWDDVMLSDDPEAPTTIKQRFDYPVAHRRQGDRLGDHRRRLDRRRSTRVSRLPPRRMPAAAPADRERRRRAAAPAGLELPRRRAVALGHAATRWP